jgi:hypothetical protein
LSVEFRDDRQSTRQRSGLIALPWRAYAVRLGLELFIVFAGVYMASGFSKYQQRRADDGGCPPPPSKPPAN